jgi:serine/threonine-protein kinase RsbW
MPERTFSLQIPAEVNELAALRHFVEETAMALAIAPAAAYDVILAANELATNTIVHGYRGQPGTIEIAMHVEGDALVVVLRDQAPPFDPSHVPPPDTTIPLERRQPGGMGIHLARRLTDAMIYRAQPHGGNELILVKKGVARTTKEEPYAHDR